MAWHQALVQAVISGSSQDGFESVSKSFRRYRETLWPWMEMERERREKKMMQMLDVLSQYKIEVRPLQKEGTATDVTRFRELLSSLERGDS